MWSITQLLDTLLALVMPSRKRTYQAIRSQLRNLAKVARESAQANDARDAILQETVEDMGARQQQLREEAIGLAGLAVQIDNMQ